MLFLYFVYSYESAAMLLESPESDSFGDKAIISALYKGKIKGKTTMFRES